MKIEFFVPKDESVPTKLRLRVDDTIFVYYKRCDTCFAYDFDFYECPEDKENEILDEIVGKMIYQSDACGARWEEVSREVLIREKPFEKSFWRVYFRVRDSY